ncbi:unnamed protein product [Nesidiocoris tenuis]|uniref:Uncharacterized protein n=1 Tax=Nesidiocoris tenuis TaxID=355587 RepID=A0A6H5HDG1_9HEMI|nr:unnamed protein product [Nesidiocoris tenuis]
MGIPTSNGRTGLVRRSPHVPSDAPHLADHVTESCVLRPVNVPISKQTHVSAFAGRTQFQQVAACPSTPVILFRNIEN